MVISGSYRSLRIAELANLAHHKEQIINAIQQAVPEIVGVVPVLTCNRFELYLDIQSSLPSQQVATSFNRVATEFGQLVSPLHLTTEQFQYCYHEQAVNQLFEVASGLQSMVVGEEEVSGQISRALADARDAGSTTSSLERLFQRASYTAKRVGRQVPLLQTGRSLIQFGLQLAFNAAENLELHLETSKVLIIGTGAYAGLTVALLRELGCTEISVYSGSGRAEAFAASHNLTPVVSLTDAISQAQLVIACSGQGQLLNIPEAHSEQVYLDLAVPADLPAGLAASSGAKVLNLANIQQQIPALVDSDQQLKRARLLVAEQVENWRSQEQARSIDHLIVELKGRIATLMQLQVARELPLLTDAEARENYQLAMHRFAASMFHQAVTSLKEQASAEQPTAMLTRYS